MSAHTANTLDLTPSQQAFKDVVETAMEQLPRFIFRMFHATSGGYADLNTITAVTPLAFSHRNTSQQERCFYKLSKNAITRLANMHLCGAATEQTCFSPWSQSLPFVMELAELERYSQTCHIAVLDTTLLDRSNVVLHTTAMDTVLGGGRIYPYPNELLAYGIISGPCYNAVPLSDIHGDFESISNFPTVCQAFVDRFNENFKLAIAAHCVSLCTTSAAKTSARERLISTLSEYQVPVDWRQDPKVMDLDRSFLRRLGGVSSIPPLEAAELIRDLVLRSVPARVPRELRGLRIDMKGWN